MSHNHPFSHWWYYEMGRKAAERSEDHAQEPAAGHGALSWAVILVVWAVLAVLCAVVVYVVAAILGGLDFWICAVIGGVISAWLCSQAVR